MILKSFELNKLKSNDYNFYLSGVMIEKINGHINYDFGDDYKNFDESKLLKMYNEFKLNDVQGADKNPSVIHIDLWKKVGGLSEEFNPGDGSDPDFCKKLWDINVRVFKCLSSFKIYHFGSITTRRKNFKINDRVIGDKSLPLVIAEIGQAHEGSIERAFKFIDRIKDSGGDAAKFQLVFGY